MKIFKRLTALVVCVAILILVFPASGAVVAAGDAVLKSGESQFINLFEVENGQLTSPKTDYINEKQISNKNFNADDLEYVPYFSYTVNSPARRTRYTITVKVSGEKDGYVALLVDDSVIFEEFKASKTMTDVTFTGRMNAGEHTVAVTAVLPKKGEKAASSKLGTITISDTISVAEKHVSPIDGLSRIEAETYGSYNLYNADDYNIEYSAGAAASEAITAANQAYSTLKNGIDLTKTAAITYTVKAPADGNYELMPGFVLSKKVKDKEQYFALLVNDSDVYKVKFSGSGANGLLNKTVAEVALKKGENKVSCIPYTDILDENGACTTHVQDFLGMDSRLSGVSSTIPTSSFTRLEGEEYAETNKYDEPHQENPPYSGGVCIGSCYTAIMQTYEQLRDYGLDYERTPYVAYTVSAPESGLYTFSVGYAVSEISDGQFMAVIVNGNKPIKSYFEKDENTPVISANKSTFTVRLRKGRNSIYCVPYVNVAPNSWHNQDYLDIDNRLTGLKQSESVVLRAGESSFINLYKPVGNNVGNANTASLTRNDISKDTAGIANLADIPYFSYTVEAPEDGYYGMTAQCYMDGSALNNNTAYIGIAFDNQFITKKYMTFNDNGARRADVPFTFYMTKGVHTVTVTCTLPETVGGKVCWTDFTKLTLYNGLKKAEEQKTPYGIMIRLEAEIYGTANKYKDTNQLYPGMSNNHIVGNCNTWGMQDFESLKTRLDKINTPFVMYRLAAPEKGEYKIKLGYYLDTFYPEEDQFFAVVINGKVYKSAFVPEYEGSKMNDSELVVELKKGVNEIYCIPYVNVNNTWHNQDYIDIDPALTGVEPIKYQRLEAEKAAEPFNFSAIEPGKNYYSGDAAVAQGAYNFTDLYTEEQQKKGLDPNNPHVGYVVEAPADGEYFVRVGFVIGSSNKFPANFVKYVYIYVNGTPYRVESPADEIAIQLVKGKNEIVCGIFSKEQFLAMGKSMYINYDYLDISDSVTCIMPSILEPESPDYTRYEAEKYALTTGLSYGNDTTSSGDKILRVKAAATAQTLSQISSKGLNSGVTPYAEYTVNADKAGDYKVRLGFKYAHTGTEFVNNGKFTVVVLVNGKLYKYVYEVKDNRNHFLTIKDTVTLKKGKNVVQVVSATGDSVSNDKKSTVAVNQDYLDVEKGLTVSKISRLEAEDSICYYYYPKERYGASGGNAACSQNFKQFVKNNITFDTLTKNNVRTVPSVRYDVVAEKAGTYTISFGYHAGRDEELDGELYFAMIVNSGAPVKVYYPQSDPTTCIAEVKLNEGKNSITVTSPLLESYKCYNTFTDSWYVQWIDHDYINMPDGVTALPVLELGKGDGLAGFGDDLVLPMDQAATGVSSEEKEEVNIDKAEKNENESKFPFVAVIIIVISALVIAGATVFVVIKRKRKKAE